MSGFKLNLDIDNIDGGEPAAIGHEAASVPDADNTGGGVKAGEEMLPQSDDKAGEQAADDGGEPEPKKRKRTAWGCVRGIIYAVIVLAASGVLAYYLIAGVIDYTGINKSDVKVPVTLTAEQAKDTAEVARVLEKAGVIDRPFIFRLYCKLAGHDGKFTPQDEAPISPDMGYKGIVGILKSTIREVVRVTFPEGMTVAEIAKKLEDNKVCTASEFYSAMDNSNFEYDFLAEIPDGDK